MKKFNWGFIGASNIAKEWMINAVRNTDNADVTAVLSSDKTRAERYAEENGISRACPNLSAFLALNDLDIVYISTTNELHTQQVIAAAKAGKHVLCEKPLATNLTDARRMIDACKENGVILGTNHHLRGSTANRTIRNLVQQGKIGTLISVRIFHAAYLREPLQSWRIKSPEAGGGVALDITVHDADLLRFITGEDVKIITSLKQNTGMAQGGLEDGIMSVLETTGGIQGFMHEAFTVKYAGNGLEVHGTDGSIKAEGVMRQGGQVKITLTDKTGARVIDSTPENFYETTVSDFHQAVLGKGAPAATGEDGFESLSIALAALESAHSGQLVNMNSFKTRNV